MGLLYINNYLQSARQYRYTKLIINFLQTKHYGILQKLYKHVPTHSVGLSAKHLIEKFRRRVISIEIKYMPHVQETSTSFYSQTAQHCPR